MGNMQPIPTTFMYTPPPKDKPWLAYCAIDVGSVTCGYAYSFENTKGICLNRNWTEDKGYMSLRCPAALILNSAGEPECFGFEAIQRFKRMNNEEKERHRFSYDGMLSSGNNKRKLTGNMITNKVHLALMLASHFLNYVKTEFQKYRSTGPDQVNWIIMMKDCWTTEEKTLFKDSITKAFNEVYKQDTVEFAAEMEAILEGLKDTDNESDTREHRKGKEKAVIVVASGATYTQISLCARNQIVASKVTEGCGVINVRLEHKLHFEMGKEGARFVVECKEQHMPIWLDFILQFESAKSAVKLPKKIPSISSDSQEKEGEQRPMLPRDLDVNLSYAFCETFENIVGHSIEEALAKSDGENYISISPMGRMRLAGNLIAEIVGSVVKPVLDEVCEMHESYAKSFDIQAILLAGGLGENQYFRSMLKEKELAPIYVPEESKMLALKCILVDAKLAQMNRIIQSTRELTPGMKIRQYFNNKGKQEVGFEE